LYNNKALKLFLRPCCNVAGLLFCLFAGLLLCAGCSTKNSVIPAKQTGQLSAQIKGFRNDAGEAIVSLFATAGGFPDDMGKAWQNLRLKIESGRASALFTAVPYGEYALCVLHDEDGDSQMKSSWLGQPLEGFGFSGRPEYNFGPPDFAEASFLLISEDREIVVVMRYDTARKEKQDDRRVGRSGKP